MQNYNITQNVAVNCNINYIPRKSENTCFAEKWNIIILLYIHVIFSGNKMHEINNF